MLCVYNRVTNYVRGNEGKLSVRTPPSSQLTDTTQNTFFLLRLVNVNVTNTFVCPDICFPSQILSYERGPVARNTSRHLFKHIQLHKSSFFRRFFTSVNVICPQVQEYKEGLKKQAEELVLKGFPETIVKLNAILETQQFKNRRFADIHQDINIPVPDPILLNSHSDSPPSKKTKYDNSISQTGNKVQILPTGSVPTNKNLVELVESVKPHIRRLVEDSNLVNILHCFHQHLYLSLICAYR